MSEYVEIVNNEVARVLVIDDAWTEEEAQAFLSSISSNVWIKSEDKVGRGFEYVPEEGIIRRKKPYQSWIYDYQRKMWIPPIARPLAVPIGYMVKWSEDLKNWVIEKIDE